MPISWETYIAREEEINTRLCHDHARACGLTVDPEEFMEWFGFSGCEVMPCRFGCPFRPGQEVNHVG